MKRVALYTRLSPNPNKDDTENQERDLIEFSKRSGWEIVKEYKDIHVTGSKKGKDRPAFNRMMEDANKHLFDLVLFWSLDRFSREGAYQTLQYLNQLNNWGIDYRSYTEQYLDSCGIFKDAIISIMAVVAKQERVRLIERTKAGLQTARLRGKRLGRPKAVIDIKIARTMREAGETLKTIAKKFGTSEATICRLLQ